MTSLLWLTVRVHDMEASLQFYRDLLGLQVQRAFSPAEGTDITFLKGDGPTRIELIRVQGEPIPESSNISVGIAVPDPQETFQKAERENIPVSDRMPLGPGMECRFLTDPNGVSIQIVYE